MWYQSIGTLSYKNSWIVLNVDKSIVNYYAWWVGRLTFKKGSQSYHGAHITVLNGDKERPKTIGFWRKYEGEKINFWYSNIIETNGQYYWLPVRCPRLEEIRLEMGLSKRPLWQYHLSCCYIN